MLNIQKKIYLIVGPWTRIVWWNASDRTFLWFSSSKIYNEFRGASTKLPSIPPHRHECPLEYYISEIEEKRSNCCVIWGEQIWTPFPRHQSSDERITWADRLQYSNELIPVVVHNEKWPSVSQVAVGTPCFLFPEQNKPEKPTCSDLGLWPQSARLVGSLYTLYITWHIPPPQLLSY